MKTTTRLSRWHSFIYAVSLAAVMFACVDDDVPVFNNGYIEAYVPIYSLDESTEVEITEAQEFINPGKIYKYADYIFISEASRGFHIIDNSTPSSPVKSGFFNIPKNNNIAVKDNVVYADSGFDLLAIKIMSDGSLDVRRSVGMFDIGVTGDLPPLPGFYFECVDDEKGTVIGWEKQTILDPQCYY
ncbi:hypothetical protein [Reichenbachiella agariperforans]|uniref:hypothetical protein n=1 Tax=Reichenbachiella agariperforans TaxID=156994 RepID=UPI001C0956CD|nr:hypothetical protein [Reichenbachiella agariperforans]MBU2916222.1 hypothetical protein [Reichenbachiella agariperforans]